jgi:hypothetical protein
MSEMPTQRQVRTARERRARLIAQMHRQAIETANELLTQHEAIGAGIARMLGAERLKPGCFRRALFS